MAQEESALRRSLREKARRVSELYRLKAERDEAFRLEDDRRREEENRQREERRREEREQRWSREAAERRSRLEREALEETQPREIRPGPTGRMGDLTQPSGGEFFAYTAGGKFFPEGYASPPTDFPLRSRDVNEEARRSRDALAGTDRRDAVIREAEESGLAPGEYVAPPIDPTPGVTDWTERLRPPGREPQSRREMERIYEQRGGRFNELADEGLRFYPGGLPRKPTDYPLAPERPGEIPEDVVPPPRSELGLPGEPVRLESVVDPEDVRRQEVSEPYVPGEGAARWKEFWRNDFKEKSDRVMARMHELGFDSFFITDELRTLEEQQRLYAQGRPNAPYGQPGDTRDIVTEKSGLPGDESKHQLGLARDVAFLDWEGATAYDNAAIFSRHPELAEAYPNPWQTFGEIAKEEGLRWGGDWLRKGPGVHPVTGSGSERPRSTPRFDRHGEPTGQIGGVKSEPPTLIDRPHMEGLNVGQLYPGRGRTREFQPLPRSASEFAEQQRLRKVEAELEATQGIDEEYSGFWPEAWVRPGGATSIMAKLEARKWHREHAGELDPYAAPEHAGRRITPLPEDFKITEDRDVLGWKRWYGDLPILLAKAAITIPDNVVGAAELAAGAAGQGGKITTFLRGVGFRPDEVNALLDEFYSKSTKNAKLNVAEADGFLDTVVTAMRNPSAALEIMTVSAPSWLMAGGYAKLGVQALDKFARATLSMTRAGRVAGGLQAPSRAMRLSKYFAGKGLGTASAISEGFVAASAGAAEIAKSGEFTPGQMLKMSGAGIITALLSKVGQSTSKFFNVSDVDEVLAGKAIGSTKVRDIGKAIVISASIEGLVEEMPQSAGEHMMQQWAEGRPVLEGLDQAMALGLIAGAGMAGTIQLTGLTELVTNNTKNRNQAKEAFEWAEKNYAGGFRKLVTDILKKAGTVFDPKTGEAVRVDPATGKPRPDLPPAEPTAEPTRPPFVPGTLTDRELEDYKRLQREASDVDALPEGLLERATSGTGEDRRAAVSEVRDILRDRSAEDEQPAPLDEVVEEVEGVEEVDAAERERVAAGAPETLSLEEFVETEHGKMGKGLPREYKAEINRIAGVSQERSVTADDVLGVSESAPDGLYYSTNRVKKLGQKKSFEVLRRLAYQLGVKPSMGPSGPRQWPGSYSRNIGQKEITALADKVAFQFNASRTLRGLTDEWIDNATVPQLRATLKEVGHPTNFGRKPQLQSQLKDLRDGRRAAIQRRTALLGHALGIQQALAGGKEVSDRVRESNELQQAQDAVDKYEYAPDPEKVAKQAASDEKIQSERLERESQVERAKAELADAPAEDLAQVERVVRDTSKEAKAARSWDNLRETTRLALSDFGITKDVYAIWMKPEHDMTSPDVMALMEKDAFFRDATIGNDARIRAAIISQYRETYFGEPAFFPKDYEAQQRRDAEADRLKAAEPEAQPELAESEVDREALRPAVQKLSDLVESLPDGYRGKKQLQGAVNRLVAVLDAKASFEKHFRKPFDKNAVLIANELARLEKNLRGIPASDIRSSMLEVHTQITQRLTDSGYEVRELLLRPYDPQMRITAEFREDNTLAEGEKVITRIIKPQVTYGGELIQAADVVVSEGTRPITAEEQQKRDAELKAAEEKLRTKPVKKKKAKKAPIAPVKRTDMTESDENISLARMVDEIEMGAVATFVPDRTAQEGDTFAAKVFQEAHGAEWTHPKSSQSWKAISRRYVEAIRADDTLVGKKQAEDLKADPEYLQGVVADVLRSYLKGDEIKKLADRRIVAAAKIVVAEGLGAYDGVTGVAPQTDAGGNLSREAGLDALRRIEGREDKPLVPDFVTAEGPVAAAKAVAAEAVEIFESERRQDWETSKAVTTALAADPNLTIEKLWNRVTGQLKTLVRQAYTRTEQWKPIDAHDYRRREQFETTDYSRESAPFAKRELIEFLIGQGFFVRGKKDGVTVYASAAGINEDQEPLASPGGPVAKGITVTETNIQMRADPARFFSQVVEAERDKRQQRPQRPLKDFPVPVPPGLLERITAPGSFGAKVLHYMQRGGFWTGGRVAGVSILQQGKISRTRTNTLRKLWSRADFSVWTKFARPGEQQAVIRSARSIFSDIKGLQITNEAINGLGPKDRKSLIDQIRGAVKKAQLELLIQEHVQEGLSQQLLSIKSPGEPMGKTELYSKFAAWGKRAKWTMAATKSFKSLNRGIPDQAKWWGLLNLHIMRLAPGSVSPDEVSSFMRDVIVDEDAQEQWDGKADAAVRQYLVRTLMALDMRLDYSDLTVKVVKQIPGASAGVRAEFVDVARLRANDWKQGKEDRKKEFSEDARLENADKLLYLKDDSPYSLAHEVGHYLDHKLGQEMMGEQRPLSSVEPSELLTRQKDGAITEERYRFGMRFLDFVRQASYRTDTSDDPGLKAGYRAQPGEVFARFVDWFVYQSEAMSYGESDIPTGRPLPTGKKREEVVKERFSGGITEVDPLETTDDFTAFVRLLQDMEVVNAIDGNPYSELAASRPQWSDIENDIKSAATWIFQTSPIRGGGRRKNWEKRFLDLLSDRGISQGMTIQIRERLDDLYTEAQSGQERLTQDAKLLGEHVREVPMEWVAGPGGTSRLQVSTRWPYGNDVETPDGVILSTLSESDSPKATRWKKAVADLLKEMPILTAEQQALADPNEIIEAAVESMAANLQTIWDSYDPGWRDRAMVWYQGASKIAARIASTYNLTHEQASGLIATLSPQTEWYENVRRAEIIAEYTRRFQAEPLTVFTRELVERWADGERGTLGETAKRKYAKLGRQKMTRAQREVESEVIGEWLSKQEALVARRTEDLVGKTWADLDVDDRGRLIRATYETENPRKEYGVYTPEGDPTGVMLENMAWGSYEEIAKGISIILDGSPASISWNLGTGHKIRNFFNNISNPFDARSVTIDTQAVAAAVLQPVGMSSPLMKAVFATGPSVSSLGFEGLSTIVAEAYRRVAAANDVLPNQMQAVTWTASRGLFEYAGKQRAEERASHAWEQHSKRQVADDATLAADARTISDKIRDIAGGYDAPAWADAPIGDTSNEDRLLTNAERERSDRRRLSDFTGDPVVSPAMAAREPTPQVHGVVRDVVADEDVKAPTRLKVPTRIESLAYAEAKAAIDRAKGMASQVMPPPIYEQRKMVPAFYSALLNYVQSGESQIAPGQKRTADDKTLHDARILWDQPEREPRINRDVLLKRLKDQTGNGIKPSDLKWSGITDWLKTNYNATGEGSWVRQADVVKFLEESRLAFVDLWNVDLEFAGGNAILGASGVEAIPEDKILKAAARPDQAVRLIPVGEAGAVDVGGPLSEGPIPDRAVTLIPRGEEGAARKSGVLGSEGRQVDPRAEGRVTSSLYLHDPSYANADLTLGQTYTLPGYEAYAEYLLVFPQLEQMVLRKGVLHPSPGVEPYLAGAHWGGVEDVVFHVRLTTRREATYDRSTLEEIAQAVLKASTGWGEQMLGEGPFRNLFDKMLKKDFPDDPVAALLNIGLRPYTPEIKSGQGMNIAPAPYVELEEAVDSVIKKWVEEGAITSLQSNQLRHARETVRLQRGLNPREVSEGSTGKTAAMTLSTNYDKMQARYSTLSNTEKMADLSQEERFPVRDQILMRLQPDEAFDGATRRVVHMEELQSDWHQDGRRAVRKKVRSSVVGFHDWVLKLTGQNPWPIVQDSLRATRDKNKNATAAELWDGVKDAVLQQYRESVDFLAEDLETDPEEDLTPEQLIEAERLAREWDDEEIEAYFNKQWAEHFKSIQRFPERFRQQLATNLAKDELRETGDQKKYIAPWTDLDDMGYAVLDDELWAAAKQAQEEVHRRTDAIEALGWPALDDDRLPVLVGRADGQDGVKFLEESRLAFVDLWTDALKDLAVEEVTGARLDDVPSLQADRGRLLYQLFRFMVPLPTGADVARGRESEIGETWDGTRGRPEDEPGYTPPRQARNLLAALTAIGEGNVELTGETDDFTRVGRDRPSLLHLLPQSARPSTPELSDEELKDPNREYGLSWGQGTRFAAGWQPRMEETGTLLLDVSGLSRSAAENLQRAFENKEALAQIREFLEHGKLPSRRRKLVASPDGLLAVRRNQLTAILEQWSGASRATRDALFTRRGKPGQEGRAGSRALTHIADAPFRSSQDWAIRGFKRILRLAAEMGADTLSWSSGQHQADHYNMAGAADRIRWHDIPLREGAWGVEIYTDASQKESQVSFEVAEDGIVTEIKAPTVEGHGAVSEHEGEHLSRFVGPEIANIIMDSEHDERTTDEKMLEAKEFVSGDPIETEYGTSGREVVDGEVVHYFDPSEHIALGSAGMRSFYDQLFPQWVEDYLNEEWGDPSKGRTSWAAKERFKLWTRNVKVKDYFPLLLREMEEQPRQERVAKQDEILVQSVGFESYDAQLDGVESVQRRSDMEDRQDIERGLRQPYGMLVPNRSKQISEEIAESKKRDASRPEHERAEMNARRGEVMSVTLTPAMKESVLYTGQREFAARGREISTTEVQRVARESNLSEEDVQRRYKQLGYTITDPSSAPLLPGLSEDQAVEPEFALEGEETAAPVPLEVQPGLDLGAVDYDAIAESRREEQREAQRLERAEREELLKEQAERRKMLNEGRLFQERPLDPDDRAAEPPTRFPDDLLEDTSGFEGSAEEAFWNETLRVPELPELLRFAQNLMREDAGRLRIQIKKKLQSSKGGRTVGKFRTEKGDPRIELLASLFENVGENEQGLYAVGKVLSHEIGHLVDWLPDEQLQRGTIVSRLFKLASPEAGLTDAAGKRVSFMHRVFEFGQRKHTAKEVTTELKKWTQHWNPFTSDPNNPNYDETYVNYRHSSVELYAEALSGILVDPKAFKEIAPIYYDAFFNALAKPRFNVGVGKSRIVGEQRPEVQNIFTEFQELQSQLRGIPAELYSATLMELGRGFKSAQQKAEALYENLREKEAFEWRRILPHLWREVVDKNIPVIKIIDEAERKGEIIPDGADPRTLLSGRNYLSSRNEAYLQKYFQPIMEEIRSSGMGDILRQVTESSRVEGEQVLDDPWMVFGMALFFERVIQGDRQELGNPLGFGPDRAVRQYEAVKELMDLRDDSNGVSKDDPRRMTNLLEHNLAAFRAAVARIQEEGMEAGLYTEAMFKQMQENPAYAPFRVIRHMENAMTASVYRQVGTFEKISNPADAGILKTLVTIQAAAINTIKTKTIDFLRRAPGHDEFFREAETQYIKVGDEGYHRPKEPKGEDRRNWTLVQYMEKGQVKGVWVSKEIGHSLNNESVETNSQILHVMTQANNNWFRPVFTSMNLGFQGYNFIRDIHRFYVAMSHKGRSVSAARTIYLYFRAIPMAIVRGYGLKKRPGRSRIMQKALEDVLETKEGQIIGQTMSDYIRGYGPEDAAIEKMLAEGSGSTDPKVQRKWLAKTFFGIGSFIKNTGDFIEALPKFAAVKHMQNPRWFGGETRAISDLTQKERAFIRERVGSPDFVAGGYWKPWSNNFLLFSNAIAQGWRSDMKTVFLDDQTRMGAQWKLVRTIILPTMMVFAAQKGWFGPDDEDDEMEMVDRIAGLGRFGSIGLLLGGLPGMVIGGAAGAVKPGMGNEYRRKLASFYQSMSEYDLRNYLILPVFRDDANGEVAYLRIPTLDTGRVMKGMVWQMLHGAWKARNESSDARDVMDTVLAVGGAGAKTGSDVISYTVGQGPSFFPGFAALTDFLALLIGENPYSAFMGRKVLSPQQEQRGYFSRVKDASGYLLRQVGFSFLMGKYDFIVPGVASAPQEYRPAERGRLQRFFEAPYVYQTLGRFLRWTDYGRTEAQTARTAERGQTTAERRFQVRELAVDEARKILSDTKQRTVRKDDPMVKQAVQRIWEEVYPRTKRPTQDDADFAAQRSRQRSQIEERILKRLDLDLSASEGFTPLFESIDKMFGQTNWQKVQVLRDQYEEMKVEAGRFDRYKAMLESGPFSGEPMVSQAILDEFERTLSMSYQDFQRIARD